MTTDHACMVAAFRRAGQRRTHKKGATIGRPFLVILNRLLQRMMLMMLRINCVVGSIV